VRVGAAQDVLPQLPAEGAVRTVQAGLLLVPALAAVPHEQDPALVAGDVLLQQCLLLLLLLLLLLVMLLLLLRLLVRVVPALLVHGLLQVQGLQGELAGSIHFASERV
jgi:hypothetical protein